MTEFQELVKSLDRIRDYIRQFYVYGFKVGNNFSEKSARTYDNERRRVESWLSRYTKSSYTSKGKHVYVNVGSKIIPQNPLYATWKPESLIDNGLMLHFSILDPSQDYPEGMLSNTVANPIFRNYGVVFDTQTVRLRLKEYETLSILASYKDDKTLSYALAPLMSMKTKPQCVNSGDMEPDRTEEGEQNLWQCLMATVEYFQEAVPSDCIDNTILSHRDECNSLFQFEHHFIVHTLEDSILADILTAVREKRMIRFKNRSNRSRQVSTLSGVPLKIFVNIQTGRRYLRLCLPERRRFSNSRLDPIARVTLLEPCAFYEEVLRDLEKNKKKC